MYKYLNVEPKHQTLQDCVIRAISLALAIPYYEIVNSLYKNGKLYSCEEVGLNCYTKMLDDLGYDRLDAGGKTVQELSECHNRDILLIRIDGHLTCSLYGDIYDIWDCSNKKATNYWIIKKGKI